MKTLLIGLGNPDRGDDGVGVEVARRIASLAPPGVDVLEVDDPASLIDAWADVEQSVVVDAIRSGAEPGTVITLDVTDTALPAGGWATGGTHALGLAAVVELARRLDRLPRRLHIVGVEVGPLDQGAGLSAAVASAVGPATDAALLAVARAP
ncbi:MAG: hydrogenase maturation protease [Actinomycetes bacterium]